jgi:hypothetical protein
MREVAVTPSRSQALRRIAEDQLDVRLGELDPQVRQELATSLVRQWLGNDGHAGIITPSNNYWFRLERRADGVIEVGFEANPGSFAALLRNWGVAEEDMANLLYQLSLRQAVRYRTEAGLTLEVRLEPALLKLHVNEVKADDD